MKQKRKEEVVKVGKKGREREMKNERESENQRLVKRKKRRESGRRQKVKELQSFSGSFGKNNTSSRKVTDLYFGVGTQQILFRSGLNFTRGHFQEKRHWNKVIVMIKFSEISCQV